MARTSWNSCAKQFKEELLSSAAGVNRNAQQILINATGQFLDYVQINESNLPYYTGNLHDSIAAYVSRSGRILRAVYMPQEAHEPQHVTKISEAGGKNIWGYREAINAVRRSRPLATGIGATLFVAVPYAEGANETSHHAGYYDWLKEAFIKDMGAAMRVLSLYPKGKAANYTPRRFQ